MYLKAPGTHPGASFCRASCFPGPSFMKSTQEGQGGKHAFQPYLVHPQRRSCAREAGGALTGIRPPLLVRELSGAERAQLEACRRTAAATRIKSRNSFKDLAGTARRACVASTRAGQEGSKKVMDELQRGASQSDRRSRHHRPMPVRGFPR